MNFFKYLIFILLSFFSINVFAVFYEYRGTNSVVIGDWMSTPELACKNFISKWAPSAPYVRSSEAECVYKTTDGDRGAPIEKEKVLLAPQLLHQPQFQYPVGQIGISIKLMHILQKFRVKQHVIKVANIRILR